MTDERKKEIIINFCNFCQNTATTYFGGNVTRGKLDEFSDNFGFDSNKLTEYFNNNFHTEI